MCATFPFTHTLAVFIQPAEILDFWFALALISGSHLYKSALPLVKKKKKNPLKENFNSL